MVEVQLRDGVSVVRMNRPPVNALDLELLDGLVETFGRLSGPVVITGTDSCFSAGVDLRAILEGGTDYTDRFLTSLTAAFLAIFDHPAPVVAAVNGHAIAGGCVIAMAADVRYMSAGTIGISEIVVGVAFPVAAIEICRYGMGSSVHIAALEGASVDVATAAARGWVEPADGQTLLEQAVGRARELGRLSPAAYAFTKQQLHRPARSAIDNGAVEDAAARASWLSDDTRTRIEAFVASLRR
jgi:enoyl-CoA hydratase